MIMVVGALVVCMLNARCEDVLSGQRTVPAGFRGGVHGWRMPREPGILKADA